MGYEGGRTVSKKTIFLYSRTAILNSLNTKPLVPTRQDVKATFLKSLSKPHGFTAIIFLHKKSSCQIDDRRVLLLGLKQ